MILTNSNQRHDFTLFQIEKGIRDGQEISIASAFFSETDLLKTMTKKACSIRLIVRLGFPTSPVSLRFALQNPSIEIKCYTTPKFHPKFYLIGKEFAILGSSNLTKSGLLLNREANILLPSDDPSFEELEEVFEMMWEDAYPLTMDMVDKYEKAVSGLEQANAQSEQKIIREIGQFECNDFDVTKTSALQKQIDREIRQYRAFLAQFDILRDVYTRDKRRKEPRVPIHIEIDQFLNWIFDDQGASQEYSKQPVRTGNNLIDNIQMWINAYHDSSSNTTTEIYEIRYKYLMESLSSRESIKKMGIVDFEKVLMKVYSFEEHVRRYDQGVSFRSNNASKVKETFTYLLFAGGNVEERIIRCFKDPKYKLDGVGASTVKELFGWVNKEDMPIYNERVRKAMLFLGFNLQ